MYPSVLQYQFITPYTTCQEYCGCSDVSPVINWLIFGKLPVSKTVSPGYESEVVTSGGINRYLASVTVERYPVVNSTITIAESTTASYTFTGATSAVSSNTAAATVSVSGNVVTITGVASGSTYVTISDVNSNIIAVITVVVTAA